MKIILPILMAIILFSYPPEGIASIPRYDPGTSFMEGRLLVKKELFEMYMKIGFMEIPNKNFNRAIECFIRASRLRNNPLPLFGLGIVHLNKAREYLNREKEDQAEFEANLAKDYFQGGLDISIVFMKAMPDRRIFFEKFENMFTHWLGTTNFFLGNYEEAASWFEAAALKGIFVAYLDLALAYKKLKEVEKAKEAAIIYIEHCVECLFLKRAYELLEELECLDSE